jgi:hypothetical protein
VIVTKSKEGLYPTFGFLVETGGRIRTADLDGRGICDLDGRNHAGLVFIGAGHLVVSKTDNKCFQGETKTKENTTRKEVLCLVLKASPCYPLEFFFERGIWIKMKHSINLPFYKKHPEIREKHILRSFHRHLHGEDISQAPVPPPASPRDTKTLETPQELALQANHGAPFPLNDHRQSHRQGKEMNNRSNVGINRRLLLGSTVGFCWDQPSALAGIDRRLLLGSTASCKVSSANGNCTRRFGAAERHTFSVFLIAI